MASIHCRTTAFSAIVGTYDAIPPPFRIAIRTVGYYKIIVRNTFVERDLDKRKCIVDTGKSTPARCFRLPIPWPILSYLNRRSIRDAGTAAP